MKTIKCHCGKNIILDDDVDVDEIASITWRCEGNRGAVVNNGLSLSWLVVGKPDQGQVVDHINHDTHDNQRINLRLTSHSQNNHNREPGRNNLSGYKGVSFVSRRGNWIAQININKKVKHLGTFQTSVEAAMAYNKAAREVFGDFAYQNKIPTQAKQ